MEDVPDGQMRYRAWVTVGPSSLPFGAAIGILQALNRHHPELSAIGSGGSNEGQVYAVSCDAEGAREARRQIGMAFRDAIAYVGLKGDAKVKSIQLERIW